MSEIERAQAQRDGLLKPMRPGNQAAGSGLARSEPVSGMSEIALPEPAAWLVASSLHWIADPARTPRAYTYVEMTRHDVEDCERAPIYTAEQVRVAILAERVEVERLRDVLETLAAQSSGVVGSTSRADCMASMAAAAIRRGSV